ncbi:MAG TPA: myxosortase-dependent metalloprotease, MXAN_2677/MXAN_2678 family [Archangium sp.]|jgi:MYXO-CTERM domain-containing protein|uniref:myxosortase-dependent metalloprotease, MXAN_2677/MXAN_2678 family n=1 Tax=Archangium sp. TaxID=1872627 RepID=UPI002EDAB3DA
MLAPMLVAALALGQTTSEPYVRSRVTANDPNTHCLFWTVPTITWQLSSVGNPKSTDAQKQNEFAAIRASFQSWQDVFSACGNLRIQEAAVVDDREVGYELRGENRNIVLFRSRRCADPNVVPSDDECWDDDVCGNVYDCWDGDDRTIALTLTTYDEKSGIIYDSDIQLNSAGFAFTTVDKPACTQPITINTNTCVATDVQNTMTHEIGHLIGLDHTLAAGSTMYPRAPPGEISKRTVDDGSRNFVCMTYPRGQPSQSCVTPSVVSTRGSPAALGPLATGCSSADTGGGWPALLGGALLAWRRRRGGARS